mgnify:FL=1
MALQKNLQDKIDPQNPYRAYAESFKWSAPTTKLIDKMSNWDMQNRGMNLQEAAQRAREALDFYDLPGGMPDIFTPDNLMTGPMAGALTSYGRVPANLYKSALTEQNKMGSNQAIADLVGQLQGIAPEGLPPQYGVIMDAISQNPETFSGMIDPVLNKFGEVDSERRGIEAATQREQTVRSIVNELGFNDLVSTMLLTPEFSDIAMQEIKKQFPDRESQLKIQKLEAEIEKIKADTDKTKADTDYTQTRTVNITKVDDDAAFTKEFRARYQSYLNELRSSNMPTVPMSEAEFAKTQGKEVYDRYNKILNPTRGESTGVPSGSIIQQAENLERQFGDTREAILGTLSDPKMSEEILETLMERYNKQHGTNWDKNTWAEEWAKANKIDTGEKKPWWKIW